MKSLILKLAFVISILTFTFSASVADNYVDIAQEENERVVKSRRNPNPELEENEKVVKSRREQMEEEKNKAQETPAPTNTVEEETEITNEPTGDEEILDRMDNGELTTPDSEVELSDEAPEGDEEGGSGMLFLIIGVAVVVLIIAVVASKKKK